MNLQQAQEGFNQLWQGVDKSCLASFFKWTQVLADSMLEDQQQSNEDVMMNSIRDDLRQALPQNAILPSEQIQQTSTAQPSDCDPAHTVHVDAFLYDDSLIDDLCDEGSMSRNYCKQCGSHQVAPLTFLSHSISLSQLKYLFQFLQPDLRGKTLVDVGSRLGVVLYGAYYYSGTSRIVGVEINKDLCELQQNVVGKHQLQDRLQVVCADICTQAELLQAGDVIVMNNVFEYFAPVHIQQSIWNFLHQTVRKSGTVLVVSPSLEESLAHLETNVNIEAWVKKIDVSEVLSNANLHLFGSSSHDDSDLEAIHMYTVL